MNKITIIHFVILCCFSTISLGQTTKFAIGLEGGPSLTSLRGNDILKEYNDPKIGFSGGLTLQYNLSKLVFIRTNIAFERKGAISKIQVTDIFNPEGTGEEIMTHTNFDYMTVPLLPGLTFGPDKIKLFVNIGPYLGYLIKQSFVTEAFREIPQTTTDDTSNNERFDIGLITGFGAKLLIKEKMLMTIEIRNNLGLFNVSKVPVINDGTIKTNSTNLLIGIAYQIGLRNK